MNKIFGEYLMDLIPFLTKTGTEFFFAGTHSAFSDGCSADVTENFD